MKNYLFLIVLFFISCTGQNNRKQSETNREVSQETKQEASHKEKQANENTFESTAKNIISAFVNRDPQELNKYIHPENKLFIIASGPGVFPVINRTASVKFDEKGQNLLDENGNSYPITIAKNFTPELSLSYDSYPEFDCGEYNWTKFGLFADTTKADASLVNLMNDLQSAEINIPEEYIKTAGKLSENSVKVALTDKKNGYLIFSLARLGDKWYLVYVDIREFCSV